jgi:hypothetical protein
MELNDTSAATEKFLRTILEIKKFGIRRAYAHCEPTEWEVADIRQGVASILAVGVWLLLLAVETSRY